MAGTLQLTVLTPERVLLSVDEAVKVRLRLADGAWLSIYPNHAPLVAETLAGPLQYETEIEAGDVELGEGILCVIHNRVDVLTRGPQQQDTAPEEIETERKFDRLARQLMLALGAHAEGGDREQERTA